jgi:hypothetical protein
MPVITASDIKDMTVSEDGALTSLIFATKYVGDFGITIPSACIERLIAILEDAKGKRQDAPELAQLRVRAPKTWAVTAELQQLGTVIVAFDHQAETRTGYALSPEAARDLAHALVRDAEKVLASKEQLGATREP